MKIVVVSCVAPPETVVSGRVNFDICEYLSSIGNEIILITPFPSRPLGKFERNNKKGEEVVEVNENFIHVKINSYQSPNFNFLKRIYESFSFGLKSIRYINKIKSDIDLIYATPWPFIGQLMFVIFRQNTNVPLVMNVQDLYPESFFTKYNFSLINLFLRPLVFIDKYIAFKSSHLSVVSESMKNVYIKSRGVNSSKISVIENWQNEEEFLKSARPRSEILQKYGLNRIADKFIFMYLGNIGPVAGLENVIHECAKLEMTNSCIVIAGSGTAKANCVELANSFSLSNVLFVDIPTGIDSVVELQSIADVLLLPIHPDASASSIPSKLIAYMFSSKPILSSAKRDSTTGIAISENNCGLLVDESNTWSERMYQISLMDRIDLEKMGRNAFEYGINRYSKKNGLVNVEKLFNKIVKK